MTIIIRRPHAADLQAFLDYRNDAENLRLQPIQPIQAADAAAFLMAQSNLADDADNCWIMFAVERSEDQRMIGEVGIYIEAATKQTGDIGWSMNQAFCGHGYATEAARLLLDYAFNERKLQRVTASMSAHNLRSIRLCERLGMRLEKTMRHAQPVGDGWHDVHQFVLESPAASPLCSAS
jgi:RimJ/RimL family protein N-acetyltransferase